jgi:tetratricopeptide (TPR) repeat protein
VAILAYVASITRIHEVKEDVARKENNYAKYIIIAVSILISLYLFIYTVLFPLMSNLDILSSLRNSPTSYANIATSTNKNIKSLSSAINRNSFGRLEANEQMLQQASRLVLVDLTQMEEKDKIEASKSIQEFKTLAELSFSKVIADEPTARNTSFYGTYMRSIGQYEKSLSLLEVANSMAPNKQLINLEYATVLAGTGQLEKGLEIAKRSYESEPTFETSKSVYENIKKIADTNKLPKPKPVIKK